MIASEENLLRSPRPERDRWTPLRAGLVNMWEYDEQVFVFHKGRLLLRGRNESGKTKALEVLFPFLLDADLAPHRLDPFGSTARQMIWNLLGDAQPEVQVAVGYVWMEFGRRVRAEEEFFTVGAGFRAVRSSREVKPWYFTTSRRLGLDFALVAPSREPLTRRGLEEALQDRGRVWERREDYRREVNRVLFGMREDQYGALVDALLHLRRPQLSRTLDPDRLSDFLTESLPPLDPEIVRQIAEGFERLDRHRQERDLAARNLKEIRAFEKVYREYLRIAAKARAQALTSAESAYHKAREELRQAEASRDAVEARLEAIRARLAELEGNARRAEGALEALRSSDEFRAVEQIRRAEEEARDQAERVGRAERRREEAAERAERLVRRLRAAEEELAEAARASARALEAARAEAARAAFDAEHRILEEQIRRGERDAARDALEVLVRARREAIGRIEAAAREADRANADLGRARDRLSDAESDLRLAMARAEEARGALREARAAYIERASSWLNALRLLGPLPEVAAALEADEIEKVPDRVRAAAEKRRGEWSEKLAEAAEAARKAEEEVARIRGEREALSAESHRRPAAPPWRAERPADRPGAPFYLLCEFSEGLDPAVEAGLEAALEAGGFLDAWVTPEGVLLDSTTADVFLEPRPRTGRTLAEWLRPTERDGVPADRIRRILETIGIVDGDPGAEEDCWVSPDGRFRNGPLRGAARKSAAEYVGETARERARARRLAELAEALAGAQAVARDAEARRQEVRRALADLEGELRAAPDLAEVERARAAAQEAEREAGRRAGLRDEAARKVRDAEERFARARARRDALAAEHGLAGWVEALEELKSRTSDYRTAAIEALSEAGREALRRAALEEVRREHDEAASALRGAEEARRDEAALREKLEGRLSALKERLGRSYDEVLRRARGLQEEIDRLRREIRSEGERRSEADTEAGRLRERAAQASARVAEEDSRRRAAEADFREFAQAGLLAGAGLPPSGVPSGWSFTDALLEARRVDQETAGVDPGDEARQKAENRLLERHNELLLSLPPEIKGRPEQDRGVWIYACVLNGRPFGLAELVEHLAGDLKEREERLAEDERRLLEEFLSGETREHVRRRLRSARDLVDRMNAQLERRPTPSGMRLKLRWDVREEERTETRRAIELLMKSPELMTDADRAALEGYLRERLRAAREGDPHRALAERMAEVLDYRRWHRFEVVFRTEGTDWRRLTRKAHEAGSGGQKAMMLHLPLFAAAAAFYDSAAPGAARLIALDEAFAGIDHGARGELLGLLAEFDLDLIMTSFEEWGCYAEVDGLSIYHLSREPGLRGVYAERFLWDGKRRIELAERP